MINKIISFYKKLYRLYKVIQCEGFRGVKLKIANLLKFELAKLTLIISKIFNKDEVNSAYGVKFKANYEDLTFKFYTLGSYGFFYSTFLNNIDHKFYFLDIGANQGLYSIIAAKNEFCQGVTAFEPVSSTADICLKNFDINDVEEKINLIRKAISDSNGVAHISIKENHSGVATIAKANTSFSGTTEIISTINHVEIDKLFEEKNNIPIYVKIDVEGHEEVVIKELLKTHFSSNIKNIFYELDERWHSAEKLSEMLETNGFELKIIGEGTHFDVMATLPNK